MEIVTRTRIRSLDPTKLFEEIFSYSDTFKVVMQTSADKFLLRPLYQQFLVYLKDLARRCEMEITSDVLELSAQLIAGAFVGILRYWLEEENPHPPDKMGEFFTQAIRPILRTAVCNGELDYIFN